MKIPFHRVPSSENEIDAVSDVIRSGWWTTGRKCIEFEQSFTELTGSRYSLSVSSCTAALHLALKAVGVSEGDEVIIPTNTFVATIEAVAYLGAVPVLCDVNDSDHNIDTSKISDLISKRTKAIVPVHFAGFPCDMNKILVIAKEHNLKVVEDAAHALPSYYKGKMIGSLSDATCFLSLIHI